MALYDDLQKLAERIQSTKTNVETEEATKHSFILPFFQILGYDIFDPNVIVPEFTADFGAKKGEKVDYAILNDGVPVIIVEAKKHTEPLDKYSGQLFRYFSTLDIKFALLTNGIEYRFYSDLNKENKLDESPFLVINLEDLKQRDVKSLERFMKNDLNIDAILEMASKQRNIIEIKAFLERQIKEPSDEFVKFIAGNILPQGMRVTANVVEEFRQYVKTSFGEMISDLATKKINSLKTNLSISDAVESSANAEIASEDDGIVTTEEELQGFFIVKAILGEEFSLDKIYARDTRSYFGILYDDNRVKWIARLHFNGSKKYLGIHESEKQENKYLLEKLEDIYKYKEQLKAVVRRYENEAANEKPQE